MSRKADPILGVLHFFETATVEAAQMALTLAKAAVKKRTPEVAPTKKTRRRTRKDAERPAAPPSAPPPMPSTAPPMPDVIPLGQPTRRRRGKGKAALAVVEVPARKPGEIDLALPGLGPATVGE